MSQIFTLGPVLVYFHAVFYDYFVLFLPDPLADCPVIAVVKCNPSAVTPGLAASRRDMMDWGYQQARTGARALAARV